LPAGAIVEVPARADLLLLRYRFAAAALPVQEELHVGATSELTAEEIIAREREFNAAQKARLTHYEAHASVAIHYRIAAVAESVDLTSENRLYVHDGKQDYVQTALYLDGARWRGKTPPYLPFLQPEKVKELPLDIALDEGYRYTLLGRDTVEGRDCYVLGFEPIATDRSLYSGKVYIDRQLFARVRMEAVQNGLTPPLRSNAVDYTFGPVLSPEGTFWLPLRVTGQMVFEVLGQNLVVERRATYSQFVINGTGFDVRLTEAYGSGQPVFRETDQGYFRLDTTGGEQRLTSASVPRNVFLVMGVDSGLDGHPGLPFAGVNFFDFNHKGSGHQVNIAWAGPFLDLSWTNPRLRQGAPDRRPWAVSLEATLNGLKGRDKNARAIGTNSGETIDDLRESARAALGIPMGHFAKWTLQGTATYFSFARRSETDDAFVLPPIFTEGSLLLRLEYNRAGYIATAWGEAARRSTWRPWGLPGNPFSPDDRDYTRLGTSLVKAFYLGSFRKLTLALTGFEGRGLDRFSRFELGDFRSARVNGFNGAGIHFDRGLVAEPACSFTLRKTMRFDAAMQVGWVHGEQDFGPGYERVIGGVVGAQFSGPWSTLGMVRVSHGLSSTIPGKGRGGDVRVVFFKTFDRWSRKGR
ncbi:MAG TPA: hypothetical protein VNL37_06825, partial [Candidatus Polarisedimenticolia bacterium]|nr:hypothetical protein [Candidatus Polarisedimenticolia bacterium]